MTVSKIIVPGAIAALSFVGAARADTQFTWLECEAGAGGVTIFATSRIFAVESEIPNERFGGAVDDPSAIADAIFDAMAEDEEFSNNVVREYGPGFRAKLQESGGWVCVTDMVNAGGPHDTADEAAMWRDITDSAWVDTRKEIDGVELEIREFAYP